MKNIYLLLALALSGTMASAQNVGIGTTTPAYPLTVQGLSNGRGITLVNGSIEFGLYNNGSNAYIQTWSNHSLHFSVANGNAKISISTAGMVGINTTTPTAQLDVNGNFRLRGNGAAEGNVLTSDANGNATWKAPSSSKTIRTSFSADQTIPANTNETVKFLKNAPSAFNEFSDNAFNNTTGTFTAPETGTYLLSAQVRWTGSNNSVGKEYSFSTYLIKKTSPWVYLANTLVSMATSPGSGSFSTPIQNLNTVVQLNAGDEICVVVQHNFVASTIQLVSPLNGAYNFFSATKL